MVYLIFKNPKNLSNYDQFRMISIKMSILFFTKYSIISHIKRNTVISSDFLLQNYRTIQLSQSFQLALWQLSC